MVLIGFVINECVYLFVRNVVNRVLLFLIVLLITGCNDSYKSRFQGSEQLSNTELVSIQISVINTLSSKSFISINQGDVLKLKAVGTFLNGERQDITDEISWSYDSKELVKELTNSFFEFKGRGVVNIKASLYNVVSNNIEITITVAKLESIRLTPSSVSRPIGQVMFMKAVGYYSDDTIVELSDEDWFSSDTSVAMVVNGIVTPVSEGSTTIKVLKDGIESTTSKFLVTSAILESIQLTPSSVEIPIGKDIVMKAMGYYSDASVLELTDATWLSSNKKVATVIDGVVMPISSGEIVITVIKGSKEARVNLFVY